MKSQANEDLPEFYQPRQLDSAPKPSGDEYRSEFEAPLYTVFERRRLGKSIITTVLLDGEPMQFVKTDPRLLKRSD